MMPTMINKTMAAVGGLGAGFTAMYLLMHKSGAPFQERGIQNYDTTGTGTYLGIMAVGMLAGAAAAHGISMIHSPLSNGG